MLTLQVNNTLETLDAFAPEQTLLVYLREHLGLCGTKEGCASGDCGACTVIVEDPPGQFATVNACITPLGAMQGKRVITVEGLQDAEGNLHPVQTAMIEEHGSQCGFCTPGFVVSLAGHALAEEAAFDRDSVVHAISGNLCRCTGYRPIIDAGMNSERAGVREWHPQPIHDELASTASEVNVGTSPAGLYLRPATEDELADLYARHPQAHLVAGATDLWLEVTQRDQAFAEVLDLSDVAELKRIEPAAGFLEIGAAVSHAELAEYLAAERCRATDELLARFGSPQVRYRGTLGGNIGNASPIADWPPLLQTLDASVVLRAGATTREVPLDTFYTGYRQTVLAPGEYISRIRIPEPIDWQTLHFHKVSKRIDDDISSVAGAFRFDIANGSITNARVAFGGMAATPLRMGDVENELTGQALASIDFQHLDQLLAASLQPISDVRASAAYRLAMAQNMLKRTLADLR